MKPIPFLVAFVLAARLATSAFGGSTAAVQANDPRIAYEGRFAADASGAVTLGFPGVTAHLRVRGVGLTLRARAAQDDTYLDVIVDGAAPSVLRLHAGEAEYPLVANATAGEHTIALLRRNESWQGTCELVAFLPGPGGEILAAPALSARKLMFIGDSVTCGEKDAYDPSREMADKLNCNARVSYGMILATRLGAQCHLVSYGGRGVIRDWQGIRNIRNAPQFYELALPDGPEIAWDHRRYVPDAIGIQLGTNDFNQGIPDQNEFVNAYVEFVRKVRRDAPNALIFLMDSPILEDKEPGGPRRSTLHAYLEEIVRRVGSDRVILAPLKHYPGVPGNGHPDGRDHVGMADELEPVLRRALGW